MTLSIRKNQNESLSEGGIISLSFILDAHFSAFHVSISTCNISDKREGRLVLCIYFSQKQFAFELKI